MIDYEFTKEIDTSFEETVDNATNELKKEGFGILTQINVTEKFKEKLGIALKNTSYWVHVTRQVPTKRFWLRRILG